LAVSHRELDPAHSAKEGSRPRAWMNLKLERVSKIRALPCSFNAHICSSSLSFSSSCLLELALLFATLHFLYFLAPCRSSHSLVSSLLL
jgi:hypothetical protein